MRYVLLFVETEQFENELAAMNQPDRERAYELATRWFAEHADKIRGGSKLQPGTPQRQSAWTTAASR